MIRDLLLRKTFLKRLMANTCSDKRNVSEEAPDAQSRTAPDSGIELELETELELELETELESSSKLNSNLEPEIERE